MAFKGLSKEEAARFAEQAANRSALQSILSQGYSLVIFADQALEDGRLDWRERFKGISELVKFAGTLTGVHAALDEWRQMDKGDRRALIQKALEEDKIYQRIGLSLEDALGVDVDFQELEDAAMLIFGAIANVIDAAQIVRNLR